MKLELRKINTGAYDSQYFKIVDKGKDTFWGFPEPLYKSKTRANGEGVFTRIWNKIIHKICGG